MFRGLRSGISLAACPVRMETTAQGVTIGASGAPAAGAGLQGPDADDLKRALALVRDISASVDAGRTWAAIRTAVERPAIPAAVEARLHTIEVDVRRVLSVVCTPGPVPTYIGDGLVYLPTSLGFPLIGFADDLQVTASLLLHRRWDVPTTRLLERLLRPGDAFLDIGANIGYFTIFGAALVGFNGRVHAFEPNPRTFDLLSRNVRLNNVGHVCTLHEAAVADAAGDRALHTFRRNQASSTFAELPERLLGEWHERPDTQAVPVTTLDAAFAGGDVVFSCIKIDVEGSDGLLWAGGERVLPRARRAIARSSCSEWNPPALARHRHRPERPDGVLCAPRFLRVAPRRSSGGDAGTCVARSRRLVHQRVDSGARSGARGEPVSMSAAIVSLFPLDTTGGRRALHGRNGAGDPRHRHALPDRCAGRHSCRRVPISRRGCAPPSSAPMRQTLRRT